MLVGQAAYFRHLNILNVSLNSKSDTKDMSNTYAPLLSTKQYGTFWLPIPEAQKETLKI